MSKILFWAIITLIGYVVISSIFFPVHFQKIQNSFSEVGGRISYETSIDMGVDCDFSSVEFFGYKKEDVIKFDCNRVCKERDLLYSSYGCPNDIFTCYCK